MVGWLVGLLVDRAGPTQAIKEREFDDMVCFGWLIY
jgi:hypothetical protein